LLKPLPKKLNNNGLNNIFKLKNWGYYLNSKTLNYAIVGLFSLLLVGCDSSNNETDDNNEEEDISIIEDETANSSDDVLISPISCNATYPIEFSEISNETTTTSTAELAYIIDGDKTNKSSWASDDTSQVLIAELNEAALIKEFVISWRTQSVSYYYDIDLSTDKENWINVIQTGQSETNYIIAKRIELEEKAQTAKYVRISLNGNSLNNQNNITEIEAFGCTKDTSHNIELIDWYLSVQTDEDDNGKSDSIKENDLDNGYFDPRFFYVSEDNGLVFSSTVQGFRTSTNTSYVRSELREMLRKGNTSYNTQGVNKNNWVFSTAPDSDLENAGGIDGTLDVEVAVNEVTSTGDDYQIGRVIIGQIHANDDEPVRLYYRKLPNNDKGSIYIAHERLEGDDTYYELIGSRSDNASNPSNGIALDEKFSYQIKVVGHDLTVTITKGDGEVFTKLVDMSDSNYDQGGQYMYFKAGVYNQNNSGDIHDFVQATFYKIDNTH
jgi:poly(beta-D-mannuronate) lyase